MNRSRHWALVAFLGFGLTAVGVGLILAKPPEGGIEPPAQLKIGFCDLDLAFSSSQSIQIPVREVAENLRLLQEELDYAIVAFDGAYVELEAKRSVMGPEAISDQEEKLDRVRNKINAMQLQLKGEMSRAESDVMQPSVERIAMVVQKIAHEEAFHFILRSDAVLFGEEMLDITPAVVRELDRSIKKVERPE